MILDPITVEVIGNALGYTAEEMGIALRNAAYSHNIKERMDHSCALFDSNGNLLAQAEHIPVHLGSLPWGVKNTILYLKTRSVPLLPQDIVMVNDPYIAGTHLNDMTLIKPLFIRDKLVAFSANKAHHIDVGGIAPGSISMRATTLEQEGLIITPVKVIEEGVPCEPVRDRFISQVRNPDIALGDLRAQIAAVNLGEKRVLELFERYGPETISDVFGELLRRGEKRMIHSLQAIPPGTYRAEDCLEDIAGAGNLTWIRVSLTRSADKLLIDFEGTDPQVTTPFNAVFGVTLSASYFAVKSVIAAENPLNEGDLKPLRITAPEGSLVNPRRSAPVAGGNLETSQRIADTVFKALLLALPGRVPAAAHGSMNNVIVGGDDPERNRSFVYYETIGGGGGGRPGKAGVDGIQCNMTNTMNTPIEAMEQYYPLLFKRYELREGTGGAGRWTGGCGIVRSWTLLSSSAEVTVLGERSKVPPWGAAGGEPGTPGTYQVHHIDGSVEQLSSKSTLTINKHDTLVIETPGGGGYGKNKP